MPSKFFPDTILTAAGMNMITQSQIGSKLTFTRVALGDGVLQTEQDQQKLTSIISERLSANISSYKSNGDGTFMIQFSVNNSAVKSGFFHREIGIMAKVDDGEEQLYAYTNSGNGASYIYDSSSPVQERIVKVDFVVGSAANLSVLIDRSIVYTTQSEVQEFITNHNNDPEAHNLAFAAHANEFGVATLKRDRAYVVGDIAYSNHLPTWARLECVTAGKTALTEPDLSTVTTAGAYILDGKVKWILADVRDAAPVGEIQLFYSLHPGYVKANGAVASRADYPRLVAFAETNNLWVDYTLKFSGTTTANSVTVTGIAVADMAKLQREMKVTGTGIPAGTTISKLDRTALTITLSAAATAAGKIDISYGFDENFPERFGAGDGSTTFTLPNAIGRVLEAGTGVENIPAGLPNITGSFTAINQSGIDSTGTFSKQQSLPAGRYSGGDLGIEYKQTFDASRSNKSYGNSDVVQQAAVSLVPQLRY